MRRDLAILIRNVNVAVPEDVADALLAVVAKALSGREAGPCEHAAVRVLDLRREAGETPLRAIPRPHDGAMEFQVYARDSDVVVVNGLPVWPPRGER